MSDVGSGVGESEDTGDEVGSAVGARVRVGDDVGSTVGIGVARADVGAVGSVTG